MRRKIEQTITRTDKLTVKTCDLCGLETKPGEDWPQAGSYARSDTDIEALIGECYPEGDFRTRYRIDVCPPCFVDKFIPTVEKAFSVKFQESDAEDY